MQQELVEGDGAPRPDAASGCGSSSCARIGSKHCDRPLAGRPSILHRWAPSSRGVRSRGERDIQDRARRHAALRCVGHDAGHGGSQSACPFCAPRGPHVNPRDGSSGPLGSRSLVLHVGTDQPCGGPPDGLLAVGLGRFRFRKAQVLGFGAGTSRSGGSHHQPRGVYCLNGLLPCVQHAPAGVLPLQHRWPDGEFGRQKT